MNKKSDINPKTIILGTSIAMALTISLFIDILIIPELLVWCIGYGTYYLLSTFK